MVGHPGPAIDGKSCVSNYIIWMESVIKEMKVRASVEGAELEMDNKYKGSRRMVLSQLCLELHFVYTVCIYVYVSWSVTGSSKDMGVHSVM